MFTASRIRSEFLKFFERNEHRIVESSSVVPQNDPSLLFTNAGMVQFKNIFTGLEIRDYKRATTSQKCIRAGGKHNDLDQVGYTARHHTFFEMLGNFSFGDYFKEQAITFAWTFLTQELGLPKDKLIVTVFHEDEEAKQLWKKIAGNILVIPIATSDNFWSMGDSGPCGPCTEIFYDHGEHMAGGLPGTPEEDGDRYMEIWNVVFMQFEQQLNGPRIPLKKKSIDTGMGLERIAAVMQGVDDNYKIDLFQDIIRHIKDISSTNFDDVYPSYKVIADHIRSISFLIADGVTASNEGRGYVLRRILRRAMRHGNLINIKRPFLHELSGTLIDVMKDAYPELEKARDFIKSSILQEEEKFLDTLDRGLKMLNAEVQHMSAGDVLNGEKAFKLYDTYGFPLDLTEDILRQNKISVDIEGFNEALQEQKNRAKWAGSGDKKEGAIWHRLREKIEPTVFTGYEKQFESSKIVAIIKDDQEVQQIKEGETAFIVTSQTPFYAECGGQCGDTGMIMLPHYGSRTLFKVTDTVKFCNSIIAHKGEMVSGELKLGDEVDLSIDVSRRAKIKANHTATHLLQAVLRNAFGDHVVQRGSYIDDKRLRFDFAHNSAISSEDLRLIEQIVNSAILNDYPVRCEEMPKQAAIDAGATALFGEKYEDVVRTVKIDNGEHGVISFELCGGTHVSSTGRIGLFKIISEGSVGAGIRRIEAITRESVLEYIAQKEAVLNEVATKLKCTATEISDRVDSLLVDLKKINQELQNQKYQQAFSQVKKVQKTSSELFTAVVEDFSVADLRAFNDYARSKQKDGVFVILSKNPENKMSIVVSVAGNASVKASEIIKPGLAILGGRGGGSATFAQGGGNGHDTEAVIKAICEAL